jgi:hypothetical protein
MRLSEREREREKINLHLNNGCSVDFGHQEIVF